MAMRDLLVIPNGASDATVVVVDRAKTGGDARNLFLRFRATPTLTLEGTTAKGNQGASSLTIRPVHQTSGKPEVKAFAKSDCFKGDPPRGNCRAARFPVNDFIQVVKGPQPLAIHVLDLAGASAATTAPRLATTPGYRVMSFERGKRSATVVVADAGPQAKLSYRAPAGNHVILDAPASAEGNAQVTAVAKDGQCDVSVTPATSGGLLARPLAIVLSERCEVKLDAALSQPQIDTTPASGSAPAGPNGGQTAAPSVTSSSSATPPRVSSGRGCGCRGAGSETPGTSLAGGLFAAAVAFALRRRRAR
jgi:MYXO-CTERM domain-containing protein